MTSAFLVSMTSHDALLASCRRLLGVVLVGSVGRPITAFEIE
jgi:hypothetical protein